MITLALACAPAPEPSDLVSPPHGLAVATSDFSVGALATVDPSASALQDTLVATSGDSVVVSDAEGVIQIDRSPPAAVRAWPAPDWSRPSVEFPVPGGANPQDAARCADRLFVSSLADAAVYAYTLDGEALGSIDLTAWADDDGNPEAATLARVGERLFVGLQRLDARGGRWLPAGDGVVAEIDCDGLRIADTWDVGPNPSLHEADGGLLVRTGIYGEPDGALRAFDPDAGPGETLVTEADLGADLGDVAVVGESLVAITAAFDFSSHAPWCRASAGGDAVLGDARPNYLSAVVGFEGTAWIAQSVDYADADAVTGVLALDPVSCMALGSPLPTLLPPYALAAY